MNKTMKKSPIGAGKGKPSVDDKIKAFLKENITKSTISEELRKIIDLASSTDVENQRLAWTLVHERFDNHADYLRVALTIVMNIEYISMLSYVSGFDEQNKILTMFGEKLDKKLNFENHPEATEKCLMACTWHIIHDFTYSPGPHHDQALNTSRKKQ